MRKKLLITLWLLVPIVLLAYHYGPGQKGIARDQVVAKIKQAQRAEKSENWKAALEAYDAALAALPAENLKERHQILLAKAKARMYSGELPEAIVDLEGLLADLLKANGADGQIREVRGTLASAQYYAGWLMRLEGAAPDEWTLPVDEARQNYRLLSEEAHKTRSKDATDYQKNLEATIRLARMDLSELQGLPLPKQCQGCKNCSQKRRLQRESKCQNSSEKEPKEPKDARKAGVGKRPEGSGS
jgi:hypothetical protein